MVRLLLIRLRTLSMLFVGACSMLVAGCASSSPELTLTSVAHQQTYSQRFAHAYARRDDNGGTDVVLVNDDAGASAPVRQVLHVRVMWDPTRQTKAVASNAAVHWYVIGRGQAQDLIQYDGAAFVYSSVATDGTVTLTLQNATLKPTGDAHGALIDPVGASKLEGTIVARPDAAKVTQLLGEMHTTLANAANPNGARTVADAEPQQAIGDR